MKIALDRAEHRHLVRTQLQRLKLSSNIPTNQITNNLSSAIAPKGSFKNNAAAARATSGSRRKYSNLLGQLGYEQLPLKTLEKIE
ncbi:hypothetical protein HK096_002002, partial [Nowakowskiella sp. JEL0078]